MTPEQQARFREVVERMQETNPSMAAWTEAHRDEKFTELGEAWLEKLEKAVGVLQGLKPLRGR